MLLLSIPFPSNMEFMEEESENVDFDIPELDEPEIDLDYVPQVNGKQTADTFDLELFSDSINKLIVKHYNNGASLNLYTNFLGSEVLIEIGKWKNKNTAEQTKNKIIGLLKNKEIGDGYRIFLFDDLIPSDEVILEGEIK